MNTNRPGTHLFLPLIRLVGWFSNFAGRMRWAVRETFTRGDWQRGIW